MLGAIGGVKVLLPPAEVRGEKRTPADVEAVGDWLEENAGTVDGVIASVEYVAYGNLINSRISQETATDALPRLRVLERIGETGKPVYAFNLITRIPNANDAVEEPAYWAEYGTRFYRYSALRHRRESGQAEPGDADALAALEKELPPDLIADWLQRRLRNHAINLALIELLARERIAFLLITSDDTSVWGLSSREKSWLESWLRLLGPSTQARLMMHPGADEVGSALVARLLCDRRGVQPTICPLYAVPGGEQIIAPYEDRAVQLTVEGQIRACGGVLAADPENADILLGVLPPSPRRTEFRADFADEERRERQPYYEKLFARLGEWQRAGRHVALADVAYPNGADPLAIEMLLAPDSPLEPGLLASFGAWNTAGNTLGTVVAQAVCSLFIGDDPARRRAQAAFLAHRFLEDWGYQTVVRREAREFNVANLSRYEPDPNDPKQIAATCGAIEAGLRRALGDLRARGIGEGLKIAPHSVRLPWRRTFEVDFDLVRD
jgi:hypothetical protein